MSTQTYLSSLERRHRDLELQIEKELQHPAHDALLVASLKRKKLEVKDEMNRMSRTEH